MAAPRTTEQNRRIWGLAQELGLDEETLRDVVESCTGQRSISKLAFSGADLVIARLREQIDRRRGGKKRIGAASDRVSRGQLRAIGHLREQLGWSPNDLRAWLRRYFQVSAERWMTARTATNAVTALRSMVDRRRVEQEVTAG